MTISSESTKELEPKEKAILGFLYDPEKTFFHVVVTVKNTPGALKDVLDRIVALKVNVLSSFSSVVSGQDSGVWSAFVEGPERLTTEEISKSLKRSGFVLDQSVGKSEKGLLIDRVHFPAIATPGVRVILLPPDILSGTFEQIKSVFGTGGEAILYFQGKAAGSAGRA